MPDELAVTPIVTGSPVKSIAYLVGYGEYDDQVILCVCVDARDAAMQADEWNRTGRERMHDKAWIETVDFIPAGGS